MLAFLLILLLLIAPQCVQAATVFDQTKVEYVTKQDDGLINNTVSVLYQDSVGFLWMGTDIGITRYDGLYCQNYPYVESEPSVISAIYESENRWLFAWSENQFKLICFDKNLGNYLPISSKSYPLPKNKYDFVSLSGSLYSLYNNKLYHLSLVADSDSMLISGTPLPLDEPIQRMFPADDFLVLSTDDSFILYNPQTKSADYIEYASLQFKGDEQLANIAYYNNHLWLLFENSTSYCYNLKTKEYATLSHRFTNPNLQQVNSTTFVGATLDKVELICFEHDNYATSPYQILDLYEQIENLPLLDNLINDIYYDAKNKVLWISVNGQGLIKVASKSERLNAIPLPAEIDKPLQILQDIDGYIWLTTDGKGIFKSTTNSVDSDLKFAQWPHADAKGTYCLFQDPMKNIWFGGKSDELLCYSPRTNQVERIPLHCETTITGINELYYNSRSRLWMATNEGLLVYDVRNKEVLAFLPNSEEWGSVTAICEDGGGIMWIGTERGIRKVVRTGRDIELTSGYEESAGLTSNQVLSLYQNNYNQLFASYIDKVIQIDGKNKVVSESMVLHKNFSSGRIRCIIDDQSGSTWLGTNSGVIVVNNETLASYLYEQFDSYKDVYMLNDGHLLWLTEKRLVNINPRNMKEWIAERAFVITNVEVNLSKAEVGKEINDEVILDKAIYLTDKLDLGYSNNSLRIFVSDLTYSSAPAKVEYRLLPLNSEWDFTYDSNVKLNNLPAGSYTLELRSPCLLGDSNPVTRLDITIRPQWMTTWWAYILYVFVALLIALASYLYFRYRAYQKYKVWMLRNRLRNEKALNETKEKHAQMRGQLYVDLLQKLRTPISLLIAPLKELMSSSEVVSSAKLKLTLAYRNAQTMQDFFIRLQDAHQMEAEREYQVAPYTASRIANGAIRTEYDLLKASNVDLHYDKDQQVNAEIWVDKRRIHFVLQSIISNILNQMDYAGDLWFNIDLRKSGEKEYCVYAIKGKSKKPGDTSEVIDEETLRSNFLGWDIIQEINRIHGSEMKMLKMTSDEADVELWIPLGKEHWDSTKNVTIVTAEELSEDELLPEQDEKIDSEPAVVVEETEAFEDFEMIPDSKLKLLIIEDNTDIRFYMKIIFSNLYQVYLAENGQEGIEIARRELPNLVLTDVMMPVMDGFECLRILKEDFRTCHIPVIILTALTSDEDIVKGTDLGADDYILKPFNPEVLRAKVKRLMRSRVELKQIYTKLLTSAASKTVSEEKVDETNITTENKSDDPLIEKIVELVSSNLQNPDFNVKSLADMLCMSQPTLYRKVKQITGFTIIELVRGVRLKEAAELLKTKKYGIQEVSEMVGYNDVPTFRKHFVALYGTTPSTFAG